MAGDPPRDVLETALAAEGAFRGGLYFTPRRRRRECRHRLFSWRRLPGREPFDPPLHDGLAGAAFRNARPVGRLPPGAGTSLSRAARGRGGGLREGPRFERSGVQRHGPHPGRRQRRRLCRPLGLARPRSADARPGEGGDAALRRIWAERKRQHRPLRHPRERVRFARRSPSCIGDWAAPGFRATVWLGRWTSPARSPNRPMSSPPNGMRCSMIRPGCFKLSGRQARPIDSSWPRARSTASSRATGKDPIAMKELENAARWAAERARGRP